MNCCQILTVSRKDLLDVEYHISKFYLIGNRLYWYSKFLYSGIKNILAI